MLLGFTRTARTLVAIVTVGVVLATLAGCQFERAALARTPAAPSGHHQSPVPHATADLNCLVATLSTVVSLAPWDLSTPSAPDRLAHPTGLVSPPFIPPEVTLCAHSF